MEEPSPGQGQSHLLELPDNTTGKQYSCSIEPPGICKLRHFCLQAAYATPQTGLC